MTDKFVPPEPPHNRKGDVEDVWKRMPSWIRLLLVAAVIGAIGLAVWRSIR